MFLDVGFSVCLGDFAGWSTPNLANGLISWKPWNGPWDQVRGGLELVGAAPGSRFGVGRARVGWKLGGGLGVTPLKTRVGSVLRRLYSQIGFAWDQKVSHFFLAITSLFRNNDIMVSKP